MDLHTDIANKLNRRAEAEAWNMRVEQANTLLRPVAILFVVMAAVLILKEIMKG